MKTYETLSTLPLVGKSYSRKFLLIAFVAIHIPLIGFVLYLINTARFTINNSKLVVALLIFTLVSTALALPLLNRLLRPLIYARKALQEAGSGQHSVTLPTKYADEVGLLLSEVQETINQKDQAIADREVFFDVLSHDFQAPLNRIIAMAEIYELCNEEERLYNMEMIQAEAAGLTNGMEQLLSSLRQASGEDMKVDIAGITANVVAGAHYLAIEKGITLTFQTTGECIVKGDPFLLGQAIRNVLSNAIKYSGSGSKVHISATSAGGKVTLCVTDEGIGFDATDSEALIARFTHLGRYGTSGKATHGVGLSIVRRLVERYGGQLSAYSAGRGEGATFKITFG